MYLLDKGMNPLPMGSTFDTITELDLHNRNLDCKKITRILEKLAHNSNLLKLDLSNNSCIDAEGGIALAKYLKINSKLRSLNLRCTRFSSVFLNNPGNIAVIESLFYLSELQELDLGFWLIMDKDILRVFSKFVATNTTLVKLSLFWSNIGDDKENLIFESLKLNKSIQVLDLQYCRLTDQNTDKISEVLLENNTLTYLNLSGNYISMLGATSIGNALKVNTTLSSLNLSKNHIENFNLSDLIKELGLDSALTSLKFTGCVVSLDEFIKIAEALSTNCTLKLLHISCNSLNMCTDSFEWIFQNVENLLESNYTLTELWIYYTSDDYPHGPINEPIKLNFIEEIINRNKKLLAHKRFIKVRPLNMIV